MVYGLVAIVGLFFGIFLAYFVKEEIKPGRIYFILLEVLVLASLVVVSYLLGFNVVLFLIGLLFGFLLRKEYFYFGIGIISSSASKNINFLYGALVLLYGMPYGSLLTFEKTFKRIYLDTVLFFVPILFHFLDLNLISFSMGGLFSVVVLKTAKLIKFR